jgi:hypothetical protein
VPLDRFAKFASRRDSSPIYLQTCADGNAQPGLLPLHEDFVPRATRPDPSGSRPCSGHGQDGHGTALVADLSRGVSVVSFFESMKSNPA